MRRRTYVAVLGALAVLVVAVPARAYTESHRDPDDFEIAPDVHTTTKRVFLAAPGRWRVQIRVAGELGPDYRLRVLLDTNGGPGAEFVMAATVRNLELVMCDVHEFEGPRLESNCDADPFRAWWGVARADLHRDKVIRWRVVAFGGPPALTDVTDRAPDRGWYG